eukprot:CFRG5476T1
MNIPLRFGSYVSDDNVIIFGRFRLDECKKWLSEADKLPLIKKKYRDRASGSVVSLRRRQAAAAAAAKAAKAVVKATVVNDTYHPHTKSFHPNPHASPFTPSFGHSQPISTTISGDVIQDASANISRVGTTLMGSTPTPAKLPVASYANNMPELGVQGSCSTVSDEKEVHSCNESRSSILPEVKVHQNSPSSVSQFESQGDEKDKETTVFNAPVQANDVHDLSTPVCTSGSQPPVVPDPSLDIDSLSQSPSVPPPVQSRSAPTTTIIKAQAQAAPPTAKSGCMVWANLFSVAHPVEAKSQMKGGLSDNDEGKGSVTSNTKKGKTRQTTATSLGDVMSKFNVNNGIPSSSISYTSRGLINHTNMCFMHTILQTLLATPLFRQFLSETQLPFPILCPQSKNDTIRTPILDALTHFFKAFDISNPSKKKNNSAVLSNGIQPSLVGEPFQPIKLYEVIQKVRKQALGSQEDAEEFLSFILDTLHEECLAVMENNSSTTNSDQTGIQKHNSESKGSGDWEEVGKGKKKAITHQSDFSISPVTRIFGGTIRSSLKRAGSKVSITSQPFHSLQLEIAHNDVHNLNDALRHLTIVENLDGVTCAQTKREISAHKQSRLERLPAVLVLHLKRFVYDPESGIRKLHKFVPYPLQLTISDDLVSAPTKIGSAQRQYRLFSVVDHHGEEAEGGHYTCDVRKPGTQSWLRCDDSKIEPISPEEATGGVEYLSDDHTQNGRNQHQNNYCTSRSRSPLRSGKNRGDAYILFYERCDPSMTTVTSTPAKTSVQTGKANEY